jgi:predicted HicB family RNase H-like nuclease
MAHIRIWLYGNIYKGAAIYESMAQELKQKLRMKLIVRIPDELHRRLKVKAAQNGTTMTDLVVECLEKIVK